MAALQEPASPPAAAIQRHKTAIRRPGFSLPVKCLLRDGLLAPEKTLFDYGCGRGQDLFLLRDLGLPCDAWDPVHRAAAPRKPAEVVNLGYLINVIEDPRERAQALRHAWDLAASLLVVSAQVLLAEPEGRTASPQRHRVPCRGSDLRSTRLKHLGALWP
jgi:DNA phosphorothioation-associated putative methyltransferase